MKHTLDSNILIGLIQRYPRDIFPNIWHNIEKLAESNAVCICSAVHDETSQADDDLYDWAKSYLDLSVLLQMKNFRSLNK